MIRTAAVIFALLCHYAVQAEVHWPKAPFFKYEFGGTFGVSNISAALADFPGSHWGIYMRYGKHTCGFRREWDGEFLKMWGEPVYYERTGIYYGWTSAGRHVQWGPQFGFGSIIYNHGAGGYSSVYTTDSGIYGEAAINALLNVRGNGFGSKVFFNFNRFTPFAGVTIYLKLGFAWNAKRKADATPR